MDEVKVLYCEKKEGVRPRARVVFYTRSRDFYTGLDICHKIGERDFDPKWDSDLLERHAYSLVERIKEAEKKGEEKVLVPA